MSGTLCCYRSALPSGSSPGVQAAQRDEARQHVRCMCVFTKAGRACTVSFCRGVSLQCQ